MELNIHIPPLTKPFLHFYMDAFPLPLLYHFFRLIHFPYHHFTHGSFFDTTSSHGFIYPTTKRDYCTCDAVQVVAVICRYGAGALSVQCRCSAGVVQSRFRAVPVRWGNTLIQVLTIFRNTFLNGLKTKKDLKFWQKRKVSNQRV